MRNPVFPLKRALYGHPDSGTFWEQHCHEAVLKQGFRPIGGEWPACYFHDELRLFLIIYVDDFKMAGPEANMKAGWKLLRKGLSIEPESTVSLYLGCHHTLGTTALPDGHVVRSMTYDMSDVLQSCVDVYVTLAGGDVRLRSVGTPFLPEDQRQSDAGSPCCDGPVVECPRCAHTFSTKII